MAAPVGTLSPSSLLHIGAMLTLVVGVVRTSVSRCPEGHYRDGHSQRCHVCSTCPVNQIIRRPCTEASNTLCGPFSEFLEFHQAPRPSVEVGDLSLPDEEGGLGPGIMVDTRGADDNRSRKLADDLLHSLDDGAQLDHDQQQVEHHKHHRGNANRRRHHKDEDKVDEASNLDGLWIVDGEKVGPERTPLGGSASRAPSLQEQEEDENQWKVLALALIVVLCVVCIFLITFVFVICYMRSRRAHLKQVLYTADKGATRLPGRQRPFPSMQYVPVLTHAQTRTGTSGSVMALPSGGAADSSYLYSEDYDADNSGQTISTNKSSDYVYFKSPHNGNVYDV